MFNSNKYFFLAYGLVWISTSIAVSTAICITKSAIPLWTMFIPLFVNMSTGSKGN
ncbi:hypothetical protein [Maledivibacter halophilus]|uniref:Uncharacterized protein n=1 Tax=Maledivibacter halophilus TaxID=36842 RepID=A0A1T5KEN8_9FIRM|nr:hypothetical protein [Maledivibacter halophilus]SKC62176.1 hypothetical protein SAMN02194393_01740 [Maledivibacter halophilus]